MQTAADKVIEKTHTKGKVSSIFHGKIRNHIRDSTWHAVRENGARKVRSGPHKP